MIGPFYKVYTYMPNLACKLGVLETELMVIQSKLCFGTRESNMY